ncbi:hypothetical protein QVD17_38082 [Tagetes erecta]|uniref:Uncharacterized protein n=1 Tax=Tagetes erecta TaxID=13708 RepID=A0AAD8JVW1_TARER|nr:hypothetical protein QVD17_38082 [Tagetes erecta]
MSLSTLATPPPLVVVYDGGDGGEGTVFFRFLADDGCRSSDLGDLGCAVICKSIDLRGSGDDSGVKPLDFHYGGNDCGWNHCSVCVVMLKVPSDLLWWV